MRTLLLHFFVKVLWQSIDVICSAFVSLIEDQKRYGSETTTIVRERKEKICRREMNATSSIHVLCFLTYSNLR